MDVQASDEIDKIQYVNADETSVKGGLTPDPSPGVIPSSNTDYVKKYVKFTVDDTTQSISLSGSGPGKVNVEGSLPNLGDEDGRHTATLTTLEPDLSEKDRKQILFLYDTTPPDLDLVYPEESDFSPNNLSFIIKFSDEGSGFPSQIENLEAKATINGIDAHVDVLEKDNETFLLVDHKGTEFPEVGAKYSLYVSLTDRAGNMRELSQEYTVPENYLYQEFEDYECETEEGDDFTIFPETKRVVSFPISTRLQAVSLTETTNSKIIKITANGNEGLKKSVMEKISVSCSHTAVRVDPVSTSDFSAQFRITQTETVNSLNAFSYLVVSYPRTLTFNYETIDCSNYEENTEIPIESISVSEDKDSYKIPVTLYWKNDRKAEISASVEPDGLFFLNYFTYTEPLAPFLDLSASLLTLDGDNYFFNQVEEKYKASALIEKEGYYSFSVTLASDTGVWTSNDEEFVVTTYEVLVGLGSPEIINFIYDENIGTLEAFIDDIGTPMDDLQIYLQIDGFGLREFDLEEADNGMIHLTSSFPLPYSVYEAHLIVRDLANNTAQADCTIFGKPPESTDSDGLEVTEYFVKDTPSNGSQSSSGSTIFSSGTSINSGVVASLSGGLSIYRECSRDKVVAYYDYFNYGSRSEKTRLDLKYFPYESLKEHGTWGAYSLYEETSHSTVPSYIYIEATDQYLPISGYTMKQDSFWAYSFETCENKIKDVLAPEIKNITFNPADGTLTASISDHGMPASHIKTYIDVRPSVPSEGARGSSLDVTYVPEATPVFIPRKSLDTPGISTYTTRQTILSTLKVYELNSRLSMKYPTQAYKNPDSLNASTTQKNNFKPVITPYLRYLKNQKEEEPTDSDSPLLKIGNGLSGDLEATVPIPPLEYGEVFDVYITANDLSGNRSQEILSVTVPAEPPVVSLELIKKDDSTSFTNLTNTRTSTHFTATALDESGLDSGIEKSFFALDGEKLAPMSSHGSGGLKRWPYNQEYATWARSGEYPGWSDYWVDRYEGHYGALLGEGPHTALFKATDTVGLSAEKQIDFSIEYPPYIFDFQSKPKVIQDMGGPAFTATIIDSGNDIDVGGIDFYIDNVSIPSEKLYFEPVSGYFSVSGPLELANGYHSAKIAATDQVGHQATETLRFVIYDDLTILAADAELNLESVNIWEIGNQNNDGEANPGELIRLFPTLRNNSFLPLEDCSGTLSAEDNRITVERAEFSDKAFSARTTTTILQGFDVQIGDDILATTISDPYDAHFILEVTCSENDWDFPFILPIYEPKFPTDINSTVTIELNSVPRSTRESEYTLKGVATSSASFMEEIIIRVNGLEITPIFFDKTTGEFEANIPLTHGSNIIEIEAFDASGAYGYKNTFIHCFSELAVTIDNLPRSTSDPTITVTGTVTSTASIVDRVVMSINGIETEIRWDGNRGTYKAVVTLEASNNQILVEAWDEVGAYGRATAQVRLDSDMKVELDSLPSTTSDASTQVEGTVTSNEEITEVIVRVNGTNYSASFNSSTKRFSTNVNLEVGGNTIVATAYGANGGRGSDQGFVTRTSPFVPPSITITTPSNGDYFQCGQELPGGGYGPVQVSGTFSTGSSSLDFISVTNTGGNCFNISAGAGAFSAECEINYDIGFDDITAELFTDDGTSSSDTVTIETGPCY